MPANVMVAILGTSRPERLLLSLGPTGVTRAEMAAASGSKRSPRRPTCSKRVHHLGPVDPVVLSFPCFAQARSAEGRSMKSHIVLMMNRYWSAVEFLASFESRPDAPWKRTSG